MTRLLLGALVVATIGTAAALSRQTSLTSTNLEPAAGLQITKEEKNPWTSLELNNDPQQFQFAIVSDRTGGHRAKIFSRAVHQLNLLQPEFVMSVGDLIEGYSQDEARIDREWSEFDGFVKKFDMPFFFVPGNHDLTNQMQIEKWKGRYGRTYYHFVYNNVLFLAINSEDNAASTVTPEQVAAVKKILEENKGVRWTLLFLHKPLWTAQDLNANGWGPIEESLAGRNYTVFCGHVHRYVKFVRNGMNYYQLATTGGGSKLRGPRYGEFDHITWVTMKPDGPLLANILLEGVLPENLQLPDTDEEGVARQSLPTIPVKGKITLDGLPLANARVVFTQQTQAKKGARPLTADALTEEDGSFELTTFAAFDGAPAGEYKVTISIPDAKESSPKIPAKYGRPATSPLAFTVAPGPNDVRFVLVSE